MKCASEKCTNEGRNGKQEMGKGKSVSASKSSSKDEPPLGAAEQMSSSSSSLSVSSLRAQRRDEENSNERVDRTDASTADAARLSWESLVRWSRRREQRRGADDADVAAAYPIAARKVCVLGGGSFGTAMASVLARSRPELDVRLLVRSAEDARGINEEHVNRRYLPHHALPESIGATTDARVALDAAEYIIHAVPVQSSFAFLRNLREHVPASVPILSVSKGLELGTTQTMNEVIPRALGNAKQPVVCLSGPTFASEVMQELPTVIVAASEDLALARSAQQLLACSTLRVNTSTDVIGVEMAGALKNVLAIAAGIVEGLELGNNAMAALVAQGCSEIRWICERMGASNATISGPAGVGDIMLTCFVSLSRNRSVGVRLGRGERLDDILGSSTQVAEGVATAEALVAVARRHRVSLPVLTAVARIVQQELTPRAAVDQLMSLPQIDEK